jgi:hypothetical protein
MFSLMENKSITIKYERGDEGSRSYAIYAFEWVLDGSFNSGNSALFISLNARN